MCILFIYNGSEDPGSDYAVIVVSNRDEFYDRPALPMAPWGEDFTVLGGRDLQVDCGNGTWFAFSARRKKLGALLNLPGNSKDNAMSRGKIVTDYMKNEIPTTTYVEEIQNYAKECNDFVFVSLEFNNTVPTVYSYTNATDELTTWMESCPGFGNCLPEKPLEKVQAGRQKLLNVCNRFKKVTMKKDLIDELFKLLKSDERHLPDKQLEMRKPDLYKELSSIFVCVPKGRYGTRTHTLLLVTKDGHTDLIEHTMQEPIDPLNPIWIKSEFKCDIVF